MSDIKSYWYIRAIRHDERMIYWTYENEWSLDPLEAFLNDSYQMAENDIKENSLVGVEIVAHRSFN